MKVLLTLSILSTSSLLVASQCITHGFTVKHLDACDYETLLRRFEIFFEDPFEKGAGCSNTAEQELFALLGVTDATAAQAAVDAVCAKGYAESTAEYPFATIAEYGREFDRMYYQGGTFWNEEYATKYGDPELENDDGLSQVLREYAAHIKQFYNAQGRYGLVEFPNYREFRNCEAQSVYCCWPQDRQANDNNGNCDDPYDVDCIDADPADNTDLCYSNYGNKNRLFFPSDDNNNRPFRAEGPIHCHGFAWSDQLGHNSAGYRGNNLFYVSMYDHFHQRGYVSNIPGKPMCGCTEDMPVASRADCTEMDVDERLYFHYDGSGADGWTMTLEDVEITYNACQGTNRQGNADNNDLWAYANRLYMEGRLSADVLNKISKNLVGDNPNVCHHAEQAMMARNRFSVGYSAPDGWVQMAGRDAMSMESEYGPIAIREIYASSTEPIIHRACATCEPVHRHIYIKMLNGFPPSGGNLIEHLTTGRSQIAGFEWRTDFEMYSSLEDALEDKDPWQCPNDTYNYGAGFPGECSPLGNRVRGQNSRWGRTDTRRNVAFNVRSPVSFEDADSNSFGEGEASGSAYTVTGSPSILHLTSNGGGIGGTADEFQMVKNSFANIDNMVMSVHLKDSLSPSGNGQAGIMLRENNKLGGRNVALLVSGRSGLVVQSRSAVDDGTNAFTYVGMELPKWLRIAIQGGNFFTFYTSEDGVAWTRLDTIVEIANWKTRRMMGGVVVSANSGGELAEAVFESFSHEAVTLPAVTKAPTPTPIDGTVVDVGDLGGGVAMTDSNLGSKTWYLMYSETLLTERFAGVELHGSDARHIIGVRYDETISQWVFDQALYPDVAAPEHPFTPQPGDRLLVRGNFGENTITPLAGETGEIHGIRQGYTFSNLSFRLNRWNGGHNTGEWGVTGSYFYDGPAPIPPPADLDFVAVGNLGGGVAMTDGNLGDKTWYLMYSATLLAERFAGIELHGSAAKQVIGVRYDEATSQWLFDQALYPDVDAPEHPFTPQKGDHLLAVANFAEGTLRPFEGETGVLHGIPFGYVYSDLSFYLNMWDGGANTGEFWVTGTSFALGIPSVPLESVGDVGKGIAATDTIHRNAPRWYIMYTTSTLAKRFEGTPLHDSAAKNLIMVRHTEGKWVFDCGVYPHIAEPEFEFTPTDTDVLLAYVDFQSPENSLSFQGMNGVMNGIAMGYWFGDLTFHTDMWDGGANDSEVWVTGSFIVRHMD